MRCGNRPRLYLESDGILKIVKVCVFSWASSKIPVFVGDGWGGYMPKYPSDQSFQWNCTLNPKAAYSLCRALSGIRRSVGSRQCVGTLFTATLVGGATRLDTHGASARPSTCSGMMGRGWWVAVA